MHRTATSILLIAVGLAACGDVFPSDRKVVSKEFSFEQEVANQTRLVLEAINGTISIAGVAGADVVTVDGTREVHAETLDEAQQGLPEVQVAVEEFEEEIVVRTIQPQDNERRNFVVNYEINLPRNLSVLVTNANGNIDATNIDGSVSVQLSNGNVEARVTLPPSGFIEITIANGDTDLFIPVSTSAAFSAAVGNGSIEISNLELQNLVRTSKTAMGVLGEGNGAITLQTGNGRITASGF
jgi:DUF4097 and DUF4098 domain-containing protein YvlB